VKKMLIAVVAFVCIASLCYAAEGETAKATEPIGAVVETGGVFIGEISSAIEESMGGKGDITVVDETGKTRIFPVDSTVKVIDNTFNALTLNQLKKGEKVSVEYTKEGGSDKAKSIQVMQ
jgi:hypothetical protein